MNNLEMQAFMTIIECGNFTNAARKLYISQSTLSTRIYTLEKELGSKLFVRSKGIKKIELTEAGKKLAFASKNWYAFIEEVEKIKQNQIAGRLNLNFGSVDTYNTHLFIPLFKKFREHRNRININIRTYNSTELYKEVDSGRLDIAYTLLNMPMEGIIIEKVFEEPRVIIVNKKGLPEDYFKYDILNLLDQEKEIFFIGDKAYNLWHEKFWQNSSNTFFQVDTYQLLVQLLDESGYWSIVPLCMSYELLRNEDLAVYGLNVDVPKRVCYKIRRKLETNKQKMSIEIFNEFYKEAEPEILEQLDNYRHILK